MSASSPAPHESSAELVRVREELEAAQRELAEIVFVIGHDLRAPLRSIDGFGQALEEECGERLDDTGREYLQYVRDSTRKLSELLDDVVTLTQVSRAVLRREAINLSALARDLTERLASEHPARVVHTSITPGLNAHADPKSVTLALTKLLENAWKFTATRPEAHVEVGHTVDEGQEVFFVRDDGVGLDMAHTKRLFGMFRKLHTNDALGGTGAGLAIVKRIVERHGGRIWADAAVDRGATFHFTLSPRST